MVPAGRMREHARHDAITTAYPGPAKLTEMCAWEDGPARQKAGIYVLIGGRKGRQ